MAYVIGDDCIACGTCIDECPAGAISEGDKYSINPDVCTECGTCADVCPSEAISLVRGYQPSLRNTLNYVVKNEWASVEEAHFFYPMVMDAYLASITCFAIWFSGSMTSILAA